MAQSASKKTSKTTSRTWIFRGFVIVSVLANIAFVALIIVVTRTGYLDYAMASRFFSRQIGADGCPVQGSFANQVLPDSQIYGEGAQYCFMTTIQSPSGEILSPYYVKGQKVPR